MVTRLPYNVPIEASADSGIVLIDGPDGTALSLTPEAAEESGRRMFIAAAEARQPLGKMARGPRREN